MSRRQKPAIDSSIPRQTFRSARLYVSAWPRTTPFSVPVLQNFLILVDQSNSMQTACKEMEMSYSKGWKMLKIAEAQLGIQFLERQTGGSKGGFSVLTPEGKAFLEKFRRMEAAVQAAAEAAFEKIFLEPEEEEKEDTDGRKINAF